MTRKILSVFAVLALLTVTATVASAGWFTDEYIKARRALTVATATMTGATTLSTTAADTDVLHMDGYAAQSADFIECDSSAAAVLFKVTSDGTITGSNAETLANTPDGIWASSGMLKVPSKTSDPCAAFSGTTSAGAMGAIFYNSTGKYMCFCNGNTPSVDLKLDGSSAACF